MSNNHIQNEKDGRMMGREPFFATPEEFSESFYDYCEKCDETGEKPTIPALAWHLGFASKQSIYDYAKKPEFEYIVGRCKLFCEKFFADQLANGRGDAGVIFALKQFGWSDKQEIEHSEKVVDSGDNEW